MLIETNQQNRNFNLCNSLHENQVYQEIQ